jgi:hypothetical protein
MQTRTLSAGGSSETQVLIALLTWAYTTTPALHNTTLHRIVLTAGRACADRAAEGAQCSYQLATSCS